MKLKLVSDGTFTKTWLEDENGEKIKYITSINWKIDVGTGYSTMVVEMDMPVTVIEGEFYLYETEKTVETYRSGPNDEGYVKVASKKIKD